MLDSLSELELRRAAIAQQISKLRDFRPGSLSGTSGRCGKPSCHCHQPGQPVHGPHRRLTYKVVGKTVSESLSDSAAERKAEREIAEFRNFQRLSKEFVEVNARICRLRPVEETSPSALNWIRCSGWSTSPHFRHPRPGNRRDGRALSRASAGRLRAIV